MTGDIFDLLDLRDTEWQERALCASVDPWLFFQHEGSHSADALKLCRQCPVRAECLESALSWEAQQAQQDMRYTYGVWGGTTARERRAILRQRRSNKAIPTDEGDAA